MSNANYRQTVVLLYFLFIFKAPCMCRKIRYDGEYKKFCKIFWKLNKAALFNWQIFLVFGTVALTFVFENCCPTID